MVLENIEYKTADHEFRANDEYAQGKYDVTTRWLAPLVKPGQLLLNIGCGSGEFNAQARAMGLRVIAAEPEAEAYEVAARSAPAGCDVRHCGLLDLVGRAPAADFVVMHDVLEHIEDEAAAVEALRKLLKPDGVLILSVPAHQWLFGLHDVNLGHFRRYTRRTLLPLFHSGFTIETARYYGAAFIPVVLWISRIARKPYPQSAVSDGPGRAAMRFVCQLESRHALPVGTSLLMRARRTHDRS